MPDGIRNGTGAIVKYFKGEGETMLSVKDEVEKLSDQDIKDLVGGIKDKTLTY